MQALSLPPLGRAAGAAGISVGGQTPQTDYKTTLPHHRWGNRGSAGSDLLASQCVHAGESPVPCTGCCTLNLLGLEML